MDGAVDDIRTSIILEKNELMYLVAEKQGGAPGAAREKPDGAGPESVSGPPAPNPAAMLAELTGVKEPDKRAAVASLMKKNVISIAGNRLATVKLFDFYIGKLLSAENAEMLDGTGKKAVFSNPGIVLLVKEHALSRNHVSIQAFRTKEELEREAGKEQ